MKKSLSLFLALIMLLTCFTGFTASATEEEKDNSSGGISDMIYSEETIKASKEALSILKVSGLDGSFYNLDDYKAKNVDLIGMDIDYLYKADRSFIWSTLDIYWKDENGALVRDDNGMPVPRLTLDDISNAMLHINMYLQRFVYNKYGGLNLYNVENAIALANFIGKMLYPDFSVLNVNNFKNYFSNEIPSAVEFYKAVTTLSGLDVIIENNWLTQERSFYSGLVNLLGGSYLTLNEDNYKNGLALGSKLIEGAVVKLLTVGPVDYIYDIINCFSMSSVYETVYVKPVLALFAFRTASVAGKLSEEKLRTFDGLLHLVFCDCDITDNQGCYAAKPVSADHFIPLDFPAARFSKASTKEEKLLYLFYYLNLCGSYRSNGSYIDNLKKKITANTTLSDDDKTKLSSLLDGFFLNNFESALDKAILPMYKDNISTATDSLLDRMKNSFMVFLKKIADYFEYIRKILSGELEYGQGNSPFN